MIKQMNTDAEIRATYPVMSQLRSHLSEDQYLAAVRRQEDNGNYRIAAVVDDAGVAKCVAGYRLTECLCWGKFMYVDDLVTDEQARSEHYGQKMMAWLVDEARKNDCKRVHLDSGVQRHSAHRFYLRERMDIIAYHFAMAI
ncbi:MAG TPA: GNAT family N-acetyltransferase [Blastocatellia bacterium]|nr:GNAT family N-acetyltransferase [Blastocatellia bacterium]